MPTQIYPFDNPANYTLNNAQVSGSVAKLDLVNKINQSFQQPFTSDVGFTYDPLKAEFVAGVLRPKKVVIPDELSHVSAIIDANSDRSTGSSTAAANVGATLATIGGNQYLDISGGITDKSFSYDPLNADFKETGAIRFKVITGYGAMPPANRFLMRLTGAGLNNSIAIFHQASGNINMRISKDTGVLSSASTHPWIPDGVSEDEIEINFDFVTGATRIFINGVQSGPTVGGIFARTNVTAFSIGPLDGVSKADYYLRDFQVFDAVQHTTNFPLELPRDIKNYQEADITLPNFLYTGPGALQSLDVFSSTEVNVPRYTINNKYWNGSSWVSSDSTYLQANNKVDIVANISSLAVIGTAIISAKCFFQEDFIISSVDVLDIIYTGEEYALEGYLEPTQPLNIQEILSYAQNQTEPIGTEAKLALALDGILNYWDGAAWVVSDGTESETNTPAEVSANLGSLALGGNTSVGLRWHLYTTDATITPEIADATIAFDFGAVETSLVTCTVHGYYKDVAGNPVSGVSLIFSLYKDSGVYQEAHSNIIENEVTTTTDANGYFEQALVRTSEYTEGGTYKVKLNKGGVSVSKNAAGTDLTFAVPDAESKDITELLPTIP